MRSLLPVSAGAVAALLVLPNIVVLSITGVASVARGEPQSRVQQACIVAVERGFARVADAQLRALLRCARRAARGEGFAACGNATTPGIEKAHRKAAAMARNNCAETPDFGGAGIETVSAAGENAANGLFADVFGTSLDEVLIETSDDKSGSACQQSVAKALLKCQRAHAAEFERCARSGLKRGEIDDAQSLASCLENDTRGAIARECATAIGRLADKCEAEDVDLAAAFPACSLAGGGRTLEACVARAASCRACEGQSRAGRLEAACDACALEALAIASEGAGAPPSGLTIEDVGREDFPEASTLTSSVFEVGPDGTELALPITVALPIDPNTPTGTRIQVLRLDEKAKAWEPVPGSFVAGDYAFVRTDRLGTFSTRPDLSGTGCHDTWQAGGAAPVPPLHRPGAVQVIGATGSRQEIVFAGARPVALGSSWSTDSCIAPVEGTFEPLATGAGAWRDYSHPLVTPIPSPSGGAFAFSITSSLPASPRGPHFAITDPCLAPLDVYSYQLDVDFTSDCTDRCEGVTCDDGDPCTDDACDPGSGKCVATRRTTCGTDGAGICIQGMCTLAVPLDGTTTGNQSCAAIGLTCVDPLPVFTPPQAACLTFHPTARVSVSLSGWRQSVWCDGDQGLACAPDPFQPKVDNCHDCPTCADTDITCADGTSTDLSELFVRCE